MLSGMPRLCNKTVLQCRCACQAVRAVLPQCRRHKYMGNMPINSRITGKTMRCWVFSRAGGYAATKEEF